MKQQRTKLLAFLILILLASGTGCWNRRELNTLAVVSGIAVDKTAKPGIIEMTAQIFRPSESKGSSKEGGSSGKSYINLKTQGVTGFHAVRNFTFQSSRKFFWSHNQIIVFGEELARSGVSRYTDFFLRDPEMRSTVWVRVAKGKASGVLETDPGLEKLPAQNIERLIEDRKVSSQVAGVDLAEFTTRLLSLTTAPVATLVETSESGGQKVAKIVGSAVFKKDKMVDILDYTETRGLLWVLGEVESGLLVINMPDKGKVSLEITRASAEVVPEIKKGSIVITIKIREEGNLGSQSVPVDLTKPEIFKSLEKLQAEMIKTEINAAWKKARQSKSDIFGFGDALHRRYPKEWKTIEKDWDQYFPEIKLSLDVEAKLRRVGMTTRPPTPEKKP